MDMDENERDRIDRALNAWRQGDCVLGPQWFLYRLDAASPLTEESVAAAAEGADAGEAEVAGFMLVTQTCDIVRACADRPFVQVCPLVQVPADRLSDVQRERLPRFVSVPGLASRSLVADLDRVMSVEKAAVARWERTAGCHDDADSRTLARALARKQSRAAFPDDFVQLAQPLVKRMSAKHGKQTDEGHALRSLREIRVRAAPAWSAESIALTIWFIRDAGATDFDERGWHEHAEAWLRRLPEGGRFEEIDGVVLTLDDLTARDYVESDRLDLDHLSG